MTQAANLATLGSNAGSTGVLASAAMPVGSVLQVVNTTTPTASYIAQTTSTTMASTGFSVTITPKFANSKILVTVSSNGQTSATGVAYYTIYRNSTNLATGSGISMITSLRNSNGSNGGSVVMSFIDSPATTSATTYTVYFCVDSGITGYFGYPPNAASNQTSTFIAQEISA